MTALRPQRFPLNRSLTRKVNTMLCPRTVGALAGAFLIGSATLLAGPARAQAPLAKANSEASTEVRLEVTELKRTSGGTVTLKALISNDSAKTFAPPASNRIYLLDATNRMKHAVVKDERGKPVANANHNVKAHERMEIWAKFGAPPQGVQKLTVVIPKFSPLEDVPLSQ
jgi:hypothetical protein